MPFVARFRLWVRALLHRRRAERELDRELRAHLEMEMEQRIRDGMPPDDARRAALLAFGGVERHKESVRDERGTRFIEEFILDFRHAVRSFAARPAFTATAAITMAIGIGSATAVFSLANWVFLRPVPGVVDPRRVVRIDFHGENGSPWAVSPVGISVPNLDDLRRGVAALPSLAGSTTVDMQLSVPGGAATNVEGTAVSGDYFGVLGVQPAIGRFFTPDERDSDRPSNVVIVSDEIWRDALGATTNAIGRSVRINGSVLIVIGVAPKNFRGIDRIGHIGAWVPMGMREALTHRPVPPSRRRSAGIMMDVIGRLADGVAPSVVEAQVRAAMARLADTYPADNEIYKTYLAYVTADLGLIGYRRHYVADIMRTLSLVVAIVLLISCANAANLLLLRGVRRRNEIAVRRALGGSSARLLRQRAVEGVVLAVPSALAGIAVTFGLRTLLRSQSIPNYPSIDQMPIDVRVLAFAVTTAFVVSVIFALVTAIPSLRTDILDNLKDGARTDTGRAPILRRALTIAQIAACMSLAVAGSLFARTLHSLAVVDIGVDVAHTAVFTVDASPQGYDAERIRALQDRVVRGVAEIPGVNSVAFSSSAPLAGGLMMTRVRPAGGAVTDEPVRAMLVWADPSYFHTFGIPILSGTAMPELDGARASGSIDHVVIGRALAHALFGEAEPLGREFTEDGRVPDHHVVVGVVEDVRMSGIREPLDRVMYAPGSRSPWPPQLLIVRAAAMTPDVTREVRRAIEHADPAIPVRQSWTMAQVVGRNTAGEQLFAHVLALLGALTALLTGAGIYGIIAYSVAERTREIGVRVALGAGLSAIVGLVTRQLVVMIAVGLALGGLASVWLARLVASRLFGVTPLDPFSYIAAASALLLLGLFAAVAPARTAARVNPIDALRHE